jgi:hypothetical protein
MNVFPAAALYAPQRFFFGFVASIPETGLAP